MLKNKILSVICILFVVSCNESTNVSVKSDDEKTIYSMGHMLGSRSSELGLNTAEKKVMAKGFKDAVLGSKPAVKVADHTKNISTFVRSRTSKSQEKIAKVEKDSSKNFLAKMAKEKGAETTKSGLIYIPIKEGKGEMPKLESKVKVHYHGTLVDGTVFDSSVDRKSPASFPLMGVVACWKEGLQKIKVGGKAKLICPSEIAYGNRGAPPKIKPGATLVFEVELLEILKK